MATLADLEENSFVEVLSFLGYDLGALEPLRLVAKCFLNPCDARKEYIHRLFQEVSNDWLNPNAEAKQPLDGGHFRLVVATSASSVTSIVSCKYECIHVVCGNSPLSIHFYVIRVMSPSFVTRISGCQGPDRESGVRQGTGDEWPGGQD